MSFDPVSALIDERNALRAYAVAFAQKLAECGPVEHSADDDIGLPAGIICQSCCTWAKPDGSIEHDDGCIIPKVEEFFRANPPAPALRYCDVCDGTGSYEGGTQILTKCEECEGTGTVEGEVRGGAPSDSLHQSNHQPGSLPPRFKRGDGSFEDWYEGYFAGCTRPNGTITAMLRHAFEGAREEFQVSNVVPLSEALNSYFASDGYGFVIGSFGIPNDMRARVASVVQYAFIAGRESAGVNDSQSVACTKQGEAP